MLKLIYFLVLEKAKKFFLKFKIVILSLCFFFLPKGINKWLLKESLNGLMPEKLIHRPKMGFGVPIGSWLKDQLKPWASDLLDPNTIRRYGYLDPDEVTKKWNLHLSGKEDFSEQIWSILMFQSWLEDGN